MTCTPSLNALTTPVFMQKDHTQLWAECSQLIKDSIGNERYRNWFRDVQSLEFSDGRLRLLVPSEYFASNIERLFVKLEDGNPGAMMKAIWQVYGPGTKLYYSFQLKQGDPETLVNADESKTPQRPAANDAVGLRTFRTNLTDRLTLSQYCVSECNNIAYNIAMAIAEHPEKRTFNPFYVFGPTGSGKTHLIQGLGSKIHEDNPNARVYYTSSRQFELEFTTAMLSNKTNLFFSFYQSIDVLIIDDIQDLSGKYKIQNTFFNIFNHLFLNNKLLIFSSDRSPADMKDIMESLLGRFRSGSTVEILKPDLHLRLEVLRSRVPKDGIPVPNEVIEFVAMNITESIRELEGVIMSLMAQATAKNEPITLPMAREVVNRSRKLRRHTLNFDIIADKVTSFYGLDPDIIYTSSHKREISDARHMAVYLAKKHTDMSLKAIGRCLNRSHPTMIHSLSVMEARLGVEARLREDLTKIEQSLI